MASLLHKIFHFILFYSASHPAALRSPEISEIIVLEIETLQFVLVPCALIIMYQH